MNATVIHVLAPLAGYLLGAVPFGYLIFRAVKGIDIRTVGSGNIGATNVGRQLGFGYFLLVFALDLLKGLLPTWGIPAGLRALGAVPGAELPVLVALATVLGHNFPVYLGFKGGKGVATSLGALLALDPAACAAAALGFFVVFGLTRFVSLSSIAGALAFVVGHLARVKDPWSPEDRPMTLLAIGIALLLIVRHHRNLVRIVRGTEPRVPLRRSRTDGPPSGKVRPLLLLVVVAAVAALAIPAAWIARRAGSPVEAVAGPWLLRETDRVLTGQQRANRVVFTDGGRTLAVLCPRYNKVLLYRVTPGERLEPAAEVAVEGRPVAIAAAGGRLVVLQRPPGDDKHLGPGWFQAVSLDGRPSHVRIDAGYYPDDCAITPDGRHLLVLSSGRAEGDAKKPLPGLEVFQLGTPGLELEPAGGAAPIGRLEFAASEDPDRLVLSATGTRALVVPRRGSQALALDLSRPESPRLAGRVALDPAEEPRISRSDDGDWILMPPTSDAEAVGLPPAGGPAAGLSPQPAGYVAFLRPEESVLEIAQAAPARPVGRIPILGPLNLGKTRPSGLAACPERGLLAVATKPGAVHLIAIRSRLDSAAPAPQRVAAGPGHGVPRK